MAQGLLGIFCFEGRAHWFFCFCFTTVKVARDTLGSLLCIYLKRMHEVEKLILTARFTRYS